MKYLIFILNLFFLISCTVESTTEECKDLDITLWGDWKADWKASQYGPAKSGIVTFEVDGTLVDPSEIFVGGHYNNVPYTNKSYRVSGNTITFFG